MLEAVNPKFPANAMVKLEQPGAIVSIQCFTDAALQLRAALGVDIPERPIGVTADGVTYLWSGPDAWLAVSDDPGLEMRINAAVAAYAAVTDQTDGRAVFRVAGLSARQALAKLVPIDLHSLAFPNNATALTLAGHITVQIWRDGLGDFHLACFRSFAESLYESLMEACREYEG